MAGSLDDVVWLIELSQGSFRQGEISERRTDNKYVARENSKCVKRVAGKKKEKLRWDVCTLDPEAPLRDALS